MATEVDTVRRVTQTILYAGGSLVSFLMAVAAYKGVVFSPSGGSRAGPPSNWYATPLESSTAQILLTATFTVMGFWLLWLAYGRSKQTDERHRAKRKKKRIKK